MTKGAGMIVSAPAAESGKFVTGAAVRVIVAASGLAAIEGKGVASSRSTTRT